MKKKEHFNSNPEILKCLEEEFIKNPYRNLKDCKKLGLKLKYSDSTIYRWFTTKRKTKEFKAKEADIPDILKFKYGRPLGSKNISTYKKRFADGPDVETIPVRSSRCKPILKCPPIKTSKNNAPLRPKVEATVTQGMDFTHLPECGKESNFPVRKTIEVNPLYGQIINTNRTCERSIGVHAQEMSLRFNSAVSSTTTCDNALPIKAVELEHNIRNLGSVCQSSNNEASLSFPFKLNSHTSNSVPIGFSNLRSSEISILEQIYSKTPILEKEYITRLAIHFVKEEEKERAISDWFVKRQATHSSSLSKDSLETNLDSNKQPVVEGTYLLYQKRESDEQQTSIRSLKSCSSSYSEINQSVLTQQTSQTKENNDIFIGKYSDIPAALESSSNPDIFRKFDNKLSDQSRIHPLVQIEDDDDNEMLFEVCAENKEWKIQDVFSVAATPKPLEKSESFEELRSLSATSVINNGIFQTFKTEAPIVIDLD